MSNRNKLFENVNVMRYRVCDLDGSDATGQDRDESINATVQTRTNKSSPLAKGPLLAPRDNNGGDTPADNGTTTA